jgi:tetratricopeptide (TPR) repeat protein
MHRHLVWSWILILASPAFGAATEAQRALEQGLTLDSQGRYAESRDAYSQAIRLEPKFFEAWYKRGWARNRLGDSKGAIEDFDKALQLEPGKAPAWNGRGAARDKDGNVAGALQDFQKAIDLDPTYHSPWGNRALLKLSRKDYRGALDDANRALQLNPSAAEVWHTRGTTRWYLADYAGSIADFTKAIALNGKDASNWNGRASAKLKIGDNRGALEDLDRALALNPKKADVLVNRGSAKKNLGDFAGARADYEQALALNASNASAKQGLALLDTDQPSAKSAGTTPKNLLLETPATGQVVSTAAESPAKLAPPKVVPAPVPAPAPLKSSQVLAPFTGYAMADPCKQAETLPGVPWRPDALLASGTVGSARLGQYEAMLRHTMESLRLLYGPFAPVEEKNFNAFWAPFFDHPTKEALDYFQQITPLLDEMAITLSNLDGLLPGMGDALEGTMLAGGDPASGETRIAAVQYQRVKAERARLDDLSKKISALGNPPNPIAAKCAAHQHHRKAMVKEEGILALLKTAQFLRIDEIQNNNYVFFTLDENVTAVGHFNRRSLMEWSWAGTTFKFSEQDADYESPPVDGTGRDRTEVVGNLSPDGTTIEHLTCRTMVKWLDPSTNRVLGPRVPVESEVSNIPLLNVTAESGWQEITYDVKGNSVAKCMTRLVANSNDFDWKKSDEIRITFVIGKKPFGREVVAQVGAAINKEFFVRAATVETVKSGTVGQGAATTVGSQGTSASATAQQAGMADPESDPKVNAEAIAEHLALAEQIRREADRWAADAAKETDPDRRKELQSRAAAMAANAQSEKDIADSLRTGTMVHTRTNWDEQQHQTMVSNIKSELAVFDAESKLLANIPKVADMVAGVEGVNLREQAQNDITDAIHSPDALKKLAAIYGKLQDKVIDQGQQQIEAAQDKVELWDRRLAIAENVEMAAGMGVTLGALWAPAEVGTLALGYAGSTGFAEGGVKGATVAIVRSVSSRADVLVSAYEGATKIDPATGQPAGAWGAVEGALWSIGTNKAMESLGGRIQKAKADYALARQAAGGLGFAPVARAGEGRLKEFDFQTPEQRYKTELETAKTPQEQAAVNQKHAIQVEREAMGTEKDAARRRAEDAVHQGTDPATANEQYGRDLKAIDDKYATKETRNQEHQEVMKELGFDPSYDGNNKDIIPTGSKPKTAESDMDFTPVGNTPHEAYQKGKAYTEAMKKRGHNINEYGDRWVDTTNDTTVWKPGFGADKPGSGSFEAETIFGTLPNSDKFGTKGGIEWTSTGSTPDLLGAVLANTGKAVGAGLGNSRSPDLHVIGKSATKAVDILTKAEIPIKVDSKLKLQIEALKAHQTPEQAGVVDLGADPATRDHQVKSFLGKVQALMGQAIALAKTASDKNAQDLKQKATESTPDQAHGILSKVQAYQSSDKAAMDTIAQVSPGLASEMGRSAKPDDLVLAGPTISLNVGGLTRALAQGRDRETQAPALPADSTDPALGDLGKRCKQAAQNAAAKLAAAKPGSDEARYLADLKIALEEGGKNPAEAVRTVRGLSGTELPVVLVQLGAPAK